VNKLEAVENLYQESECDQQLREEAESSIHTVG
jgi:hypothetical protein